MRVDGHNGTNSQVSGVNLMQGNDSFSRMIQNQIANAQKELQELSENNDMSVEEKMKRRQEIQQRITDLNHQLRQHQIEQRRENQGKDNVIERNLPAKKTDKSGKGTQRGMSASTMRSIISADAAMSQAQVQSRVATRMEGRAGVLEAEIKQDAAKGKSVESKREELAEIQEKAAAAQTSQMNVLTAVNKDLEETAESEGAEEESGQRKAEKVKGESFVEGQEQQLTGKGETEATIYSHVDVKL